MPEGIDIYVANQTVTSWAQVKASDIDWCYQKVSDGLTIRSINPGPFAGVAQGGYHFSQPGSPVDQANLLVNRCEALGLVDLNPALDLEDNVAGSGKVNIPDSQKAPWTVAFGRQVFNRGHGFTLYANDSTWKIIYNTVMNSLPSTFRWVARYRTAPPDTPYDAWQYTSSGSCPGIRTGSLDRNRGKKPLNSRGTDMPLTDEDLVRVSNAVLSGLVPDRNFGTLIPLRESVGWSHWEGHQANTKLVALTAAVSALANDPDLTAEQVKTIIDSSVKSNLTEGFLATVSASLKEAASELELNVDNEALSDKLIEKLKGLSFKAV